MTVKQECVTITQKSQLNPFHFRLYIKLNLWIYRNRLQLSGSRALMNPFCVIDFSIRQVFFFWNGKWKPRVDWSNFLCFLR